MALKGIEEHAYGEQKHSGVPEVAPFGKKRISAILIRLIKGLNDASTPPPPPPWGRRLSGIRTLSRGALAQCQR